MLSLLPQGAASTLNSLGSNCNKVQGSASSFHDWEQLWKFQPMHVCLYFQHPLIDPGDIVHYAENMHFYTREHFLSFSSSAGGKKNKRWLSPSKSIPAMLCPPLLSRCLPLVVKSSRNMLLHTSQTPPPSSFTSTSKHVRLPRAPAVAHLFFFFFFRQMVYWIMQSFVIPAATYSQYICRHFAVY